MKCPPNLNSAAVGSSPALVAAVLALLVAEEESSTLRCRSVTAQEYPSMLLVSMSEYLFKSLRLSLTFFVVKKSASDNLAMPEFKYNLDSRWVGVTHLK